MFEITFCESLFLLWTVPWVNSASVHVVHRLLQVLLSPFSPNHIQQSLFHRKGTFTWGFNSRQTQEILIQSDVCFTPVCPLFLANISPRFNILFNSSRWRQRKLFFLPALHRCITSWDVQSDATRHLSQVGFKDPPHMMRHTYMYIQ